MASAAPSDSDHVTSAESSGSDCDVLSLVSVMGTNAKAVTCAICDSVILIPNSGKFEEFQKELPCVSLKAKGEVGYEICDKFWCVQNMFAFENVGYTNPAHGGVKYLTCADCESGPIGYEDSASKMSYVALCRVVHKG